MKPILDACCGSRMFWFNPKNPNVLFVDNRYLSTQAIWKSGNGKATRYCTVRPDYVMDFRHLQFPDESFWHIVFDPPHLYNIGDNAWMAKKYGKLPKDWKPLIHDGFHECWRVLKQNGTLIFKWNETQIRVSDVLDCIGVQPLYGHKSGRASKTTLDGLRKTLNQESKTVKPELNLTIKQKWFDMIAKGVKLEEYRDCEHRQVQRAYLAAFNDVNYWHRPRVAVFRNGYAMKSRALAVEIIGYDLRGYTTVKHPEWGEPKCRRLHLVVKLGKILAYGPYAEVRGCIEKCVESLRK